MWRAPTLSSRWSIFCAPLGRERGPTDDLVRAQEGRSKYHDPPKSLIITPPAPLSTFLFGVFICACPAPVGSLVAHEANPSGLATVGLRMCVIQAVWPLSVNIGSLSEVSRTTLGRERNLINDVVRAHEGRSKNQGFSKSLGSNDSFSRSLTQPSLSERFSAENKSASALGRSFLRAHSTEIMSQTLYGRRQPFFLDGAFSAHLLGANEVQPTTSFAPKRGAQNMMPPLNC